MTDEGQLFVSYSRADSEFVRRLVAALEARGRDPWVDWEDIPKAADWWADIQSAITGSDAFVFVLSPDSARSEVCGRELAAAEADHKRIVPVLARMAPVDEIPALIKRLNWIDFQANVDFDGAVGQLVDAVDTDLEWVKEHTRLAVRARDWESASREPSRLLRGRELDAGELWLARAADHAAPQPTTLQSAYLLASRQAATRSQRVRLALAVAAAIVALSLAALAVVQSIEADRQRADAVAQRAEAITLRDVAQSERDEAKRQRDIAETEAQRNLARSLAARAGDRTHSFDVSLLLAAEGMALDDSAETRSGIFAALQAAVRMKYFLHGLDEGPFTVAADPAGRWLAAGGIGALQLWNSADGTPLKSIALGGPDGNYVVDLAVGNDGDLLAYSSLDGVVVLDSTQDFAERKRFDVDTVGLVALDAANGRVAMGTYDGSVRLAAIDGSSDFTFVPAEGAIDGLAFASDAKRLAVGVGKQLSIWDVSGAQPTVVGSPVDLPGDIVDVEFSADGRWLAASTTDESSPLLVWQTTGGQAKVVRSSLISRAGQLAFDQKGDRLAVVGSTPFVGAGIFIFDTTKLDQSPIAVGQFGTGQRGDIEGLAIGAGTTMVSVDSAGTALEWDMVGSSPYTTDIAILDHQVDEIAASDDGSMIATLSRDDARISLYDATFSTELSGFDVPDAGLIAVAGDGSRIAYSVADTVHVMDRGGTELAVVVPADGEEIGALALDATGTQLAVHSYTFAIGPFTAAPGDGRLSVFSVSNGQRVSGPWPAGGEVVGLGWTADGTGLQGIDGGSSVVVWSLADGSPSTSPIDLDVTMHALALDRSRALFVAGVPGEGIYLFDARTPGGLQLGLIASHPGGVAFDHSGRVYAGSTLIPTVTVTEVGTQRWIEMACSMANRSLTPDEAVRYIGDGKSATACTGG